MKRFYLFSAAIAILAAFFASTFPDGLEKVTEQLGLAEKTVGQPALFANYALSGSQECGISTAMAGIAGILIIYGIYSLLTYLVKLLAGRGSNPAALDQEDQGLQ